MDDTADLREQAKQWRRLAERYSPGLAGALIAAAQALDARADGIEARQRAGAGAPDAHRPPRG